MGQKAPAANSKTIWATRVRLELGNRCREPPVTCRSNGDRPSLDVVNRRTLTKRGRRDLANEAGCLRVVYCPRGPPFARANGGGQNVLSMNIKIRGETSVDLPAIEALTTSAFLNVPHTSHTEHGSDWDLFR